MKVTLDEFLEEMDGRQKSGSTADRWMAKLWAAMAMQLWEESVPYDSDVDLPEDNEWIRSNPEWIQANPPPMEAVIGYDLEIIPRVGARFNPHHGPDGKFTTGKAGVSTSMLKAAREPDAGATISRHGDVPETGYVIAQPGTSGFVGTADEMYGADGKPTKEGIDKAVAYMDAHKDAEFLGVWHNPATGEITFDVVDVFPDDIGEAEAKRIGKERNQEAIFHLTSGNVINTGGTGDARSEEDDLETTQAHFRYDRRGEEGVRNGVTDGGESEVGQRFNPHHDKEGKFTSKGGAASKGRVVVNASTIDPVNDADLGGPVEEIVDHGAPTERTVKRMHNGDYVVTTTIFTNPVSGDGVPGGFNYDAAAYSPSTTGPVQIKAVVDLKMEDGRDVHVAIEKGAFESGSKGEYDGPHHGWRNDTVIEYQAREVAYSLSAIHQNFDTGIRPGQLGHPNILITSENPSDVAAWVRMGDNPKISNTINVTRATLDRNDLMSGSSTDEWLMHQKRFPKSDQMLVSGRISELDAVIAHEYGHVFHGSQLFAGGGPLGMDKFSMESHTAGGRDAAVRSKQLYIEVKNGDAAVKLGNGTSASIMVPALTEYAKTNAHEAYAEAFSAYISTEGKSTNKYVQAYASAFAWPKKKG